MGNVVSSNSEWKIIFDKRLPIRAGETLKGKVVAEVEETLPPTKLVLVFLGKEKLDEYTDHEYKRRTVIFDATDHEYKRRTVIFDATGILRQQKDGSIPPGTYTFPFEINLPAYLPSSFNSKVDKTNDSWFIAIQYQLRVDAYPLHRTPIRSITKRYMNVLSARLPNEKIPALILPKSYHPKLFKRRGSLSICAKVENIHVGKGGRNLIFASAFENNSTATVYRVDAVVKETITEKVPLWGLRTSSVIAKEVDVDLPGVRIEGRQGIQSHRDILQDLDDSQNRLSMNIPSKARDSYDGHLFKIQHHLKVTFFTNLNVKNFISNPSIEIPIQIGSKPGIAQDNSSSSSCSSSSSSSSSSECSCRWCTSASEPAAEQFPEHETSDMPPPFACAIPEHDTSDMPPPFACAIPLHDEDQLSRELSLDAPTPWTEAVIVPNDDEQDQLQDSRREEQSENIYGEKKVHRSKKKLGVKPSKTKKRVEQSENICGPKKEHRSKKKLASKSSRKNNNNKQKKVEQSENVCGPKKEHRSKKKLASKSSRKKNNKQNKVEQSKNICGPKKEHSSKKKHAVKSSRKKNNKKKKERVDSQREME